MPHPGNPAARGHLRLAVAPPPHHRSETHALLLARAVLSALLLAWLTVAAWLSIALALMPVAWRRAPLGRRLRPPEVRQARVIPFQPRRQALPR